MSLETATYVANLIASNPDGGDQRSTADDHIRLLKASLLRTFPKLDGAVSLSSVQYMYLNDLSASVQLQLNQLRDGSATANFAVNARYANSASTAAFIGTIPASRVPDLAAVNAFSELLFIQRAGTSRLYLKDLTAASDQKTWALGSSGGLFEIFTVNDAGNGVANILSVTRSGAVPQVLTIAAPVINLTGAITGTISNATSAASATNATNATNATFANTAAFATSAGSSTLLSGLAPSDVGAANTIAQRNSSGYLFASYFNQSSSEGEAGTITSFGTFQGDNYLRKATPAQVGAQLETRNISGRTGVTKTLSSSTPSGGSNGDIWYQY
jgi:hypothetical protein